MEIAPQPANIVTVLLDVLPSLTLFCLMTQRAQLALHLEAACLTGAAFSGAIEGSPSPLLQKVLSLGTSAALLLGLRALPMLTTFQRLVTFTATAALVSTGSALHYRFNPDRTGRTSPLLWSHTAVDNKTLISNFALPAAFIQMEQDLRKHNLTKEPLYQSLSELKAAHGRLQKTLALLEQNG